MADNYFCSWGDMPVLVHFVKHGVIIPVDHEFMDDILELRKMDDHTTLIYGTRDSDTETIGMTMDFAALAENLLISFW